MWITIIVILVCIIFAYISLTIGYNIAIIRWTPKELIQKNDALTSLNNELIEGNRNLMDGIKKMDEHSKQANAWYTTQIQILAQYMKDKHQDSYVFDNMKNIEGFKPETKQQKYKLDDILDKAKENGLDSLTEGELKFLKDLKDKDE